MIPKVPRSKIAPECTVFHSYGEYMNVILAANTTEVGARLDNEMRTCVRELVPTVSYNHIFNAWGK